MSQRSIIEINHDLAGSGLDTIAGQRIFMIALRQAIASGSDRYWEGLKHFGVRRVVQVHHSADRKVVITASGTTAEYPIE